MAGLGSFIEEEFAQSLGEFEDRFEYSRQIEQKLTDNQKGILISLLYILQKEKQEDDCNIIIWHLIDNISNKKIKIRMKTDLSSISAREKYFNKIAKASHQRLLRIREIRTLSNLFKAFHNNKVDRFLKYSRLSLVFGIASFAIYFIRFIITLLDIAKTLVFYADGKKMDVFLDQLDRRGTNILNDLVWTVINASSFLTVIGVFAFASSVIVFPIINFLGYAFDLWNESNDLKKTKHRYKKILEANRDRDINIDIETLIKNDLKEKIKKHNLSIAIASNLLMFDLIACGITIAMVVVLTNPIAMGVAFGIAAVCALTTVLCSRIKNRYKKDEKFKAEVDAAIKTCITNPEGKVSYAEHFYLGLKLLSLFYSNVKSRVSSLKSNSCCFATIITKLKNRNNSSAEHNEQVVS